MQHRAYYNEIEPYAAQWLRNLIAAGHIAPGDVDERDIRDVRPADLAGYTQCHFFAGIAGWSLALRLAGWPDDRPVWTGSCPCQPFSAAGKGAGFDDERHLWPDWFWLLSQCRPRIVFGEQVASKPGLAWFDLVSSDLEGAGYAGGANDLCAAGVGAPHIRQRLWFVAYDAITGWEPRWRGSVEGNGGEAPRFELGRLRDVGELANCDRKGRCQLAQRDGESITGVEASCGCDVGGCCELGNASGPGLSQRERDGSVQRKTLESFEGQAAISGSYTGGLAHAMSAGRPEGRTIAGGGSASGGSSIGELANADGGDASAEGLQRGGQHGLVAQDGGTSWSGCDWLPCTDGKARPVEPGTFPLAHGIPGRVGRLRAYGNAIVPQVAAEFIRSFARVVEERA